MILKNTVKIKEMNKNIENMNLDHSSIMDSEVNTLNNTQIVSSSQEASQMTSNTLKLRIRSNETIR